MLKFSLLSWLIFIEEDIGCFIMTVVGSSVTPLVYRAALAGLLVAAVCSFCDIS